MTYQLARIDKKYKTYTFDDAARRPQPRPSPVGIPGVRVGGMIERGPRPAPGAPPRGSGQTPGASRQGARVGQGVRHTPAAGARRGVRSPTGIRGGNAAGARSVGERSVGTRTASVAREKPRVHTVRAVTRPPFPTAIVAMTLIGTLLFMFMIMSFVRINEYTLEIEKLQSELSGLVAEKKELTLELEKKNDLRVIEQYATEVLGMVKIDQLGKKYITVPIEDKIEVVGPDGEVVEGETSLWDKLAGYFESLLEYLNGG